MPVYVGTSGWQYRDWRGPFYPPGLPQSRWLEHYAGSFATVESNNAFYRLPDRSTFEAWAARTPDDFVMAVKMSRFLTHIKRLADPEEPVQRFLEHAAPLGPKLGPVLVQLPPSLSADVQRLDRVLALLARVRVAVEFRNDSWYRSEVRAILERHEAALCLADRRGPLTPIWRTAPWTYVRLHEGRARPRPLYGTAALDAWADRLAGAWGPDEEVFAYFDNDHRACAPANARQFARSVARAGLRPTRVPTQAIRPIDG